MRWVAGIGMITLAVALAVAYEVLGVSSGWDDVLLVVGSISYGCYLVSRAT